MLLQNIQLCVGKRYESPDWPSGRPRLLLDHSRRVFSVRVPELLRILKTAARRRNSLSVFAPVPPAAGRSRPWVRRSIFLGSQHHHFRADEDKTTADYFINASGEHSVTKRSVMKERGFFGLGKYQETGRVTESEDRETRSQDESIKNLPKGMVEILMSDDTEGTRHGKLWCALRMT